jgi:predicted transcriptional regulator
MDSPSNATLTQLQSQVLNALNSVQWAPTIGEAADLLERSPQEVDEAATALLQNGLLACAFSTKPTTAYAVTEAGKQWLAGIDGTEQDRSLG